MRDNGKNRPEGEFKGVGLAGDTLKDRSRGSLERRKRQLRGRLIMINSALALVIIMVVLVCRVVALNRGEGDAVEVSDRGEKG